jgi:SAM-dependent methyltransferase
MPRDYGPLCAEMYDITKPVGGQYPDVPYYLRHLEAIGGRLLEACVGTGRLLVPLLRAGLPVEGIDSSEAMLAYCRRNCTAAGLPATLYRGALQTMDLPHRYHAIVISFGSFMLLSAPGEATAALERIGHHLVPGGRLFLDIDAPDLRSEREETLPSRRVIHSPDGATLVFQRVTRHDVAGPIEHHVLFYEKWKDHQIVAREVQDFPLRHYEQDELTRLLREAGFESIAVCGDYVDGAAPATASEWVCFSAEFTSQRPRTDSAGR